MAKIQIKRRPKVIPQASQSDIAFLLLLFFMVTTVFVQEKVFWVDRSRWPYAESIQKIPRNHTTTIYIKADETVLIDDIPYYVEDIENMRIAGTVQRKFNEDPNLIVCFRTDRETKYGVLSDVMRQLQDIGALKVTFETQRKTD
ncbi:MAG TPA: biopolymer transporter ExbD [Candidatus Cloacimonadota bacterium]|nr:biopolymer transporter ExbD [Candidatus Cloacimonadota bacterium]HOV16545.1 biopolymer transporter ExbD [Candidatus Cloacimonadota bacterium]HQL15125.1 biopolymer transporter ExbD [Candidatus Cloacimonadota bacterium]